MNTRVDFENVSYYFVDGDIRLITSIATDYVKIDSSFGLYSPVEAENITYNTNWCKVDEVLEFKTSSDFRKWSNDNYPSARFEISSEVKLAKNCYNKRT